jgi:hypothetical protein
MSKGVRADNQRKRATTNGARNSVVRRRLTIQVLEESSAHSSHEVPSLHSSLVPSPSLCSTLVEDTAGRLGGGGCDAERTSARGSPG